MREPTPSRASSLSPARGSSTKQFQRSRSRDRRDRSPSPNARYSSSSDSEFETDYLRRLRGESPRSYRENRRRRKRERRSITRSPSRSRSRSRSPLDSRRRTRSRSPRRSLSRSPQRRAGRGSWYSPRQARRGYDDAPPYGDRSPNYRYNDIPAGWTEVKPWGDVVPGTKFIPTKTFLSTRFWKDSTFTPEMFLQQMRDKERDVGLIIDLTFTKKYYTPSRDIESPNVEYRKLAIEGRSGAPPQERVQEFIRIANEFWKENPSRYIAVHCTHGMNRTGYMIASYLISEAKLSVDEAIKRFAEARAAPGGIYDPVYINHLYEFHRQTDSVNYLTQKYDPLPSWALNKKHYNNNNNNDNYDDYGRGGMRGGGGGGHYNYGYGYGQHMLNYAYGFYGYPPYVDYPYNDDGNIEEDEDVDESVSSSSSSKGDAATPNETTPTTTNDKSTTKTATTTNNSNASATTTAETTNAATKTISSTEETTAASDANKTSSYDDA